jgi:hypothetical protein
VDQDRLHSSCESHFTTSHSVRGKLISLTQRFERPDWPCSVELVKIMFSEGGACSACGGRGEAYTEFWWGYLRERDHLGDPDIDGRIILRSSVSGMWGYGLDLSGSG